MNLNAQDDSLKTIKAKKMMLLFSMLSIAMTFAGLTSAYIVINILARVYWSIYELSSTNCIYCFKRLT